MAYAQPHGYGQAPRGAPQHQQNYHYEEQGADGYGYGGDGGYDDGGGYQQPQPEPYREKARYVDSGYDAQQPNRGVITPQTSYMTENSGPGYGHQEQGYAQQGGQQGGYGGQGGHGGQGGYGAQGGHAGQGGQYGGQQGGYGGGGGRGGFQPQSRPPPQRPGHAATPPQAQSQGQGGGRPMNDRPPPARQYDAPRPATSGAAAPSRGYGPSGTQGGQRPPDLQPNGAQGKPRQGHRDRILPQSPNSPHTMAWDNPFGSFGDSKPPAKAKPRSHEPPRPTTGDGRGPSYGGRQSSESARSHHQPPRQQAPTEQYPMPDHRQHAPQAPAGYNDPNRTPPNNAYQQYQAPPQRNPSGSGSTHTEQGRGPAPNFSRVQSPPVRNQYTPPQITERSNTMPTEVTNGFASPARIGTPQGFQADLPFREGRAQTPVYANPQYAEAQSAVIETASDPPTATSEWTDAPPHDSWHPPNNGMLAPNTQNPHEQPSNHSSYGEFFDDYYDSRNSHASHTSEFDMPDFGNDRGKDELHLDAGTPANKGALRTAYGDPSAPAGEQNHGFNFGTDPYGQQGPGPAAEPAYNSYQQYGQGPPPNGNGQRPPPQQYPRGGGRGMPPPGRGMPPRGRGGYPGPQDRSASAGPGPRPNGAFGTPPPNGRGMPPPRGRGGPGPGSGQYGAMGGPVPPNSAPPGGGPPRGRGGPGGPGGPPGRGGGRGRGGPDSLPSHPTPMRPGLMQQPGSGQAPPAPVRQYAGNPNPNQPPNPYSAPLASEDTPVTHPELHRLRTAIQDNPGDQVNTLILVKKLVEASTTLANEGNDPKAKAKARERYVEEAYKLLKKLVGYNNQEAMFYMAECHGNGSLGLAKDPKDAFLLYQSAAKLGHAPSAYRVAVCCELGENEGGGTKRDPLKAMQWYRRAATLGDLPAMYKLGVILLKGLLGQNAQPGEAVNWLQRAADRADADNPHALHELGLLYENPPPQVQNTVIPDPAYSFELFTQSAGLGYKFSQFRLGQAYEYGQLGRAIDARQSIAWYSKAAVQEEHQSELALSGWYLTGSEGIIQQSDTEAYLWARKAAQAGLAKAEYAMGYFTETGIGCAANLEDAKRWYWRAASQNFPKARERLEDLRKGGARAQSRVSRTAMQKNQGDCKVM